MLTEIATRANGLTIGHREQENIFIQTVLNILVSGWRTSNMYFIFFYFKGKGAEIWPDKAKYTGLYNYGKKHGKGVFLWSDGS